MRQKKEMDSLMLYAEDRQEALLFAVVRQATYDYINCKENSAEYNSAKHFLENDLFGMDESKRKMIIEQCKKLRKEKEEHGKIYKKI